MSNDRHIEKQGAGGRGTRERRPYEKPSISWKEKLDMKPGLAVACARAILTDPQCQAGGLAS